MIGSYYIMLLLKKSTVQLLNYSTLSKDLATIRLSQRVKIIAHFKIFVKQKILILKNFHCLFLKNSSSFVSFAIRFSQRVKIIAHFKIFVKQKILLCKIFLDPSTPQTLFASLRMTILRLSLFLKTLLQSDFCNGQDCSTI